MIKLLTYVVVILAVLVIGQILRIFELASELRGVHEEKITDKDNRFNAGLMLAFLIAFFAFCFWQTYSYSDKLLPESASVHGLQLDWLFNFNILIITIVFVITHILLFYFAYKYYFRVGNKASFFAHSNKLEMIWTTIPAIVLSVIIIYGLKTWNNITAPVNEKETRIIELYAKQFDWTARYAGGDNKLGETNYKIITGTNALGVVPEDANSNDDIIVKGEFHIPIGEHVLFKIRSRDVIHSVYMPHFRAQMNAVPGMITQFHFEPRLTTAQMREKTKNPKFDYILLCNKICGSAHYNMQMKVVVESRADYDKWLATQKTFGAQQSESTETPSDSTQANTAAPEQNAHAAVDTTSTKI
jgi:cytochrome c oxidase subunit 2